MAIDTTLELYSYYPDLLIYQYKGKPKAYATVQATVAGMLMMQTSTQTISFSDTPSSGTFTLTYNGFTTIALNFDASASDIQAALRSLAGLNSVTVVGTIPLFTVTFTGVVPPAFLISAASNLSPVTIVTITETDITLPLAVQDAYNMMGDNPAQGIQLDVLGKYAGVTRFGVGTSGQSITLDDTDFLTLIKMAIITNNSGSSLSEIAINLFNFFGTQIYAVDLANMHLTYLVSSLVSSQLLQVFITEDLLPHPMGVNISVIIYAPIIDSFFGYVTYDNPTQPMVTRPFNTYDVFNTNWIWFSYIDVVAI